MAPATMGGAMPSPRSLIEGAGATAALGVRVARSLYSRWRLLAPDQRALLEPHAERLKGSALDLRGAGDRLGAERDLNAASQAMAAALVESAEGDPELSEIEVRRLRDDLRRELDRLAGADIKASRGSGHAQRPPRRAG
jgi:hypothetical protein